MKYVILHADGMAEHPRQDLGNKTSLQTAPTPHLDRLAQRGELGLLTIPIEGQRHGSGVVGTAILGYDPRKFYPGPGPLEAASLGVTVGEQDVVYRCTMVTLKADVPGARGPVAEVKKLGPHVRMEDATAGLIETEAARELIDAINEQLGSETIQFYPGSGHRHLMVWVNGKVRAVCTDPKSIVGREVNEALPSGDGADILRKLMDASLVILRDHPVNDERREAGRKPANCVWLWGQGRAQSWPSLTERFEISGVVVSPSDSFRGAGLCAGLHAVNAGWSVGTEEALFRTQADVALKELEKKNFAYVHAVLPDEVVHGTDPKAKVKAIEDFDRDLVGRLVEGVAKLGPARFLVVCDYGFGGGTQAMYAFDGGTKPVPGTEARRFTEADAHATGLPLRDATKFVARLFARGA